MGPLLALLIAVVDQDRPAAVAEPQQSPPPASFPSSLKQSTEDDDDGHRNTKAAVASATLPPSATDAGNAVRKVSCAGVAGSTALRGGDGGGGEGEGRGAVAAVAGAEARRDLLQKACLRLFVTGMDLFFPSCAQRCSLLARYMSKYLR